MTNPGLRAAHWNGSAFPIEFLRPDESIRPMPNVTPDAAGPFLGISRQGSDETLVLAPGDLVHRWQDGTLHADPEETEHAYIPDAEGCCAECGDSAESIVHLAQSVRNLAPDNWTPLGIYPDNEDEHNAYTLLLLHGVRTACTTIATYTGRVVIVDGLHVTALTLAADYVPVHVATATLEYPT